MGEVLVLWLFEGGGDACLPDFACRFVVLRRGVFGLGLGRCDFVVICLCLFWFVWIGWLFTECGLFCCLLF